MLQERDTGEWSGDSSGDVEDRLCMRADWTHQCLSVASTWNECLKDIPSSPGTGEAHEINCRDEETIAGSWGFQLGSPLFPSWDLPTSGLILVSPPSASMVLG